MVGHSKVLVVFCYGGTFCFCLWHNSLTSFFDNGHWLHRSSKEFGGAMAVDSTVTTREPFQSLRLNTQPASPLSPHILRCLYSLFLSWTHLLVYSSQHQNVFALHTMCLTFTCFFCCRMYCAEIEICVTISLSFDISSFQYFCSWTNYRILSVAAD
jgi:hypothetical protein